MEMKTNVHVYSKPVTKKLKGIGKEREGLAIRNVSGERHGGKKK